MLQQGWLTHRQLRAALDAQRQAKTGRIGDWLVRQRVLSEETVTRALALQWSCPVMSVDGHDAEVMSAILPRLFVDAFTALPLRVSGNKMLYLGFENAPDPVLALGISRMTGLSVECGIVMEARFRATHAQMMAASFPAATLIEAVSESAATWTFAKEIERVRPLASRLIRMHDYLWLRMWTCKQTGVLPKPEGVHDLICSIGPI
jgi:hypothetical protein